MRARAVVVGAGVGGLVAALELQARGLDVTVLERAATPGGKLRQVQAGGQAMDAGPTVFTMRWVFEALFADLGERLQDHVALQPLQVLARHAWSANERLDLFADIERSVAAIAAFSSAAEGERYRRFCQRAAGLFSTLDRPFLRSQRPSLPGLVWRAGRRGLPGLMSPSPFARMAAELGRSFEDPRLVQLFGRYATYCGSSPYAAPATLMLVAHVEQQGVWSVQGGLHALAQALAALLQQRGGTLRCGQAVAELQFTQGRCTGVVTESGERLGAQAVVFNGDVAALAAGGLGPGARAAVPARGRQQRSLSALTWNLCVPTQGFPLLRHNVFFSADYAAEFNDLFQQRRLPRAPTVYVCAQDRGDEPLAPATPQGAERLLVLVNAPPEGDRRRLAMEELSSCQAQTFALLQRCGLRVSNPASATLTEPADFEAMFPATGGALYGQASHGWRASFQRPGSRSRLRGLYLAGGSTHPGPGVPMAALSGRLAAAAVLADLAPQRASTPPWPAAATAGGTSTRSATTANTR